MAEPVEVIPLLVVAFLMMGASADVGNVDVLLNGNYSVNNGTVVSAAQTSVGSAETLYVIGGQTVVSGDVGEVVQLAGNLSIEDSASVGRLRSIAGRRAVSDSASIQVFDQLDLAPRRQSLPERTFFFLLQAGLLSLFGVFLSRRKLPLLENVSGSLRDDKLASFVVGLLVALTVPVLLVFMAMTLILIPVSIAGLFVALVLYAYAQVVYGYMISEVLPWEGERALVAGITLFMSFTYILGAVPVLGDTVQVLLTVSGVGAVIISYLGVRKFEPVQLSG